MEPDAEVLLSEEPDDEPEAASFPAEPDEPDEESLPEEPDAPDEAPLPEEPDEPDEEVSLPAEPSAFTEASALTSALTRGVTVVVVLIILWTAMSTPLSPYPLSCSSLPSWLPFSLSSLLLFSSLLFEASEEPAGGIPYPMVEGMTGAATSGVPVALSTS